MTDQIHERPLVAPRNHSSFSKPEASKCVEESGKCETRVSAKNLVASLAVQDDGCDSLSESHHAPLGIYTSRLERLFLCANEVLKFFDEPRRRRSYSSTINPSLP